MQFSSAILTGSRNLACLTAAVMSFCSHSHCYAEESKVVLAKPASGDAYQPHWFSLDQHQTPEWLQKAKVGLFVYALSPPAEHYHAHMKQLAQNQGKPYHGKYHSSDQLDLTPWDPVELAQLAKDAGARYLVFGADPHSYFLTWPSQYAGIEGSPFIHVKSANSNKDYLGEIANEVRHRHMRFGIYRNYLHPKNNPYFLETMYEMIDRYQPATIWLDEHKTRYPSDILRSRELTAYYYNHSKNPAEVAIEDALGSYKRRTWCRRLVHGDWYRKEFGPPHQDISDGHFVRYEPLYRWRNRSPEGASHGMVDNLVEWIADATAKNGSTELTIHLGPKPVYDLIKRTLRQIGIWLEVNGEGIYDTRPWYEGRAGDYAVNIKYGAPEKINVKQVALWNVEGNQPPVTPSGRSTIPVRYTVKNDSLYAILFDWPTGERNPIDPKKPPARYNVQTQTLGAAQFPRLVAAAGTTVRLLGTNGELPWEQTSSGLMVSMPTAGSGEGFQTEIPCDHAFCLKITPAPTFLQHVEDFSEVLLSPAGDDEKVIQVEGPPSNKRDRDRLPKSSAAAGELIFQERRAIPDGVYARIRRNWLIEQHPDVDLETIASLVKKRYDKLIMKNVPPLDITDMEIEDLRFVYPPHYHTNDQSVEVAVRRLTIQAIDRFGYTCQLVAYFANYDRVQEWTKRITARGASQNKAVVLQVNGHFGSNPTRLGFGLEDRGGFSGAALGKLAIEGVPLISYDDHDVGESSPMNNNENGLYRTLANLRVMDDAILRHFDTVDVVGLSGGTERLYHFLLFHRCSIRSAYLAGMYMPPWCPLDANSRMGGPYGINRDTDNATFQSNFQFADLILVGIQKGIRTRFALATGEGGLSKHAFQYEIVPALDRYTNNYTVGSDDPDGDGISNDGLDLAHEYHLPDLMSFLTGESGD